MDQFALAKKSYENLLKELNLNKLELKEEQNLLQLLKRLNLFVENLHNRLHHIVGVGGQRAQYLSLIKENLEKAIEILEKEEKLNIVVQKEERALSNIVKSASGTLNRNELKLASEKNKLEHKHIQLLLQLTGLLGKIHLGDFTVIEYMATKSKDPKIDRIIEEVYDITQHLSLLASKEYHVLLEEKNLMKT